MKDLGNSHVFGQSLAPAQRTGISSTNGTGIDMRDCHSQVTVVQNIGAVTGTSPTIDLKLQESDDDTTYADITGATMTQLDDGDANTMQQTTFYNRGKRYVRAVETRGGTTANVFGSVTLIARKKSY